MKAKLLKLPTVKERKLLEAIKGYDKWVGNNGRPRDKYSLVTYFNEKCNIYQGNFNWIISICDTEYDFDDIANKFYEYERQP